MNAFPQMGTGSVAQFPLRRGRKWRSIANELESAERILLPDAAAGEIEWWLSVQDLTDVETGRLRTFFEASQGQSGSFLFIDPLANLLGWSEDLSRPDWQAGLLSITAGVADPEGLDRAFSVSNGHPGPQSLQQTLAVPGDYVACFSAWIRSDTPGTIMLVRDGASVSSTVGTSWKRYFVGGAGIPGAAQSSFSIVLAAGQAIDIWGLQAEAQPYPSVYKKTATATGIYEETYFGADELKLTSTDVGLSSCEIVLSSRG